VGALPVASVVCLSASGTDDTDPALYKRVFPVCTPDIGISLLLYRTLHQASLRRLRGIPPEVEFPEAEPLQRPRAKKSAAFKNEELLHVRLVETKRE
jgi:hypothetical protein